MLYLKVEDEYYYSDEGKKELAAKYNLSEESFVFARSKDIILNAFENGSIAQTTFIAPYLPESLSSEFKGIFDVIRVDNKYGLLTKRQREENIDPMTILREKLGSNIYAPVVTFNDYIIDKASSSFISMMSNLRAIETRQECGIVSKGFFLTGVPGTGKTFFAKCIAGELKRYLIELNLSFFINADDTFGLLNKFFSFFKFTDGKFVLLIDEIEKMFNDSPKAKQVLGYLLTTLNEFADKNSKNKADVLFIATANNVTELVKKNPELFRKGRFDQSIYLTAPKSDKAIMTFDYYIKKAQENFAKVSIPMLFLTAKLNQNDQKVIFYDDNTRYSQIVRLIQSNDAVMEIINNYILKSNKPSEQKNELFDILLKSQDALNLIDEIKETYKFAPDARQLVEDGFSIYRDRMATDRSEFPYVPAEIESMVTDLFSDYYFVERDTDIIKFFNANTPLQISMSSGIKEMNGATMEFTKM